MSQTTVPSELVICPLPSTIRPRRAFSKSVLSEKGRVARTCLLAALVEAVAGFRWGIRVPFGSFRPGRTSIDGRSPAEDRLPHNRRCRAGASTDSPGRGELKRGCHRRAFGLRGCGHNGGGGGIGGRAGVVSTTPAKPAVCIRSAIDCTAAAATA